MIRGIYGRKFPPQQIPFQHLTHINYAFANINKESGTVALSDTWADVEVSQSRRNGRVILVGEGD